MGMYACTCRPRAVTRVLTSAVTRTKGSARSPSDDRALLSSRRGRVLTGWLKPAVQRREAASVVNLERGDRDNAWQQITR